MQIERHHPGKQKGTNEAKRQTHQGTSAVDGLVSVVSFGSSVRCYGPRLERWGSASCLTCLSSDCASSLFSFHFCFLVSYHLCFSLFSLFFVVPDRVSTLWLVAPCCSLLLLHFWIVSRRRLSSAVVPKQGMFHIIIEPRHSFWNLWPLTVLFSPVLCFLVNPCLY